MATVAPRHARCDQSRQVQDRAQIDVDQRVDIIRCHLQDIAAPRLAGIVDENIEFGRTGKAHQGVVVVHVDCTGAASGLGRQAG
ncbi:hypothetical protein ACVIW3_007186 [Bradyrhizobium diazoefficiens]|uniref:Uncharacterized protein n=1 Tax=Bradyrhizobium diazoefficiens TaxID=1355477 RepID=A0A809X0G2_9BRAD|nr:hypothetical protein [Bradyrhizobium japonicum]BBZ94223.1 hypothetical protein F07S3_40560 [Bradyrhizobium diazoefficiens]BCA11974.1 hypothetical protein BDHF08_38210 [Bradyrhizobium diazoefficiens]BCA20589.1 hypothetical protein BDHH15_38040 [Bradyrhizobium diazoefficiens]BCE21202.1 hypothetical protein XF1B_38830 [Bradyrhizobium diazoefficiens]